MFVMEQLGQTRQRRRPGVLSRVRFRCSQSKVMIRCVEKDIYLIFHVLYAVHLLPSLEITSRQSKFGHSVYDTSTGPLARTLARSLTKEKKSEI